MTPLASLALLLAAPLSQDGLTLAGGPTVDGGDRAAVELVLDPPAPYPGQEVSLTLALTLRQDLLDGGLVQLFQRELELPVQVTLPGLEALLGRPPQSPDGPGLEYVLGQATDRLPPGRPTRLGKSPATRFERSWRWTAQRPGAINLDGPRLRFAYAKDFRQDPILGVMPVDRVDAVVTGEGRALAVRTFPERDRPLEFRGDLGRFELEALALPESAPLDEPLAWSVAVRRTAGQGEPPIPHLPPLSGATTLRLETAPEGEALRVTYWLTLERPGELELPGLTLASFDPTPPGDYHVARTEPTRVTVLGGPDPQNSEPRNLPSWLPAVALGAVVAVLAAAFGGRRREPQATTGSSLLTLPPATPGQDPLERLRQALATRLKCTGPAVSGPDLAERLTQSGLDSARARQAAELFTALEGERFGGPPVPDADQRVQQLGS